MLSCAGFGSRPVAIGTQVVTDNLIRQIQNTVENQREAAVNMLRELVAIPSVTGDESAVQDRIQGMLADRGLEVDRWEIDPKSVADYAWHIGDETKFENRPNLAATHQGSGNGQSILLNAHIDTVDPGDPNRWKHDPFAGNVEDDKLYGRGSCDMKGGLVTYLVALDVLSELGIDLKGDVTINTTVGEEDGGVGALSTVLRGYRADAALITEPTRLALVPAQGGSLVMRLTVPGRSAHGAVRNEGVSAVEKFIPIFRDLLAFEAERNAELHHPLYEHLENKIPISFGVIRAGTWASTVPESLVAEGRIGMLPGEDVDEFRNQIVQRIMDVADRDPWLREHRPTVEWFGGQFAPCETPVDAPISQAVLNAHRAVTGDNPVIEGVPYGADMRLYTLLGGMPCVMYGAGDVRVAHQDNEYIDIEELLTATKTIATLLVDWCGAK